MMVQFAKFLLTGGIAALANLISRYLLSFGLPYEAAVALAYLVGMLTAYLLARRFVFDPSGSSMRVELGRFTLVNLVALVIVWSISVGLARLVFPAIGMTWHPEELAHLVGVLAPAPVSYFGHKLYAFRSRTG